LLFSATFSDEIRSLASGLLDNPASVEVAARNTASERVDQAVYMVGQKQKRELLAWLIREQSWKQVLVFTRTKHGANKLAEYLGKNDIPAAAIHGNKSQSARTRALGDFKEGKLPVLVATDIAARGLDIDLLPQVVNFELPNVPEDYVHRIGRTGRAGSSGAAVSLVDGEETKLLTAIERVIKRRIDRAEATGFVPAAPGTHVEVSDARPPRPGPRSHGRPGESQPRSGQGAGRRAGGGGNGQPRGNGGVNAGRSDGARRPRNTGGPRG